MLLGSIQKYFQIFSLRVAKYSGTPFAFGISLAVFVIWLLTGSLFEWSDMHHRILDLIISLTPFWMVFILQATQNRDSDLVEDKLDELLRAIKGAHKDLIGLQNHPEKNIKDVE